jgi:hypothetical protein
MDFIDLNFTQNLEDDEIFYSEEMYDEEEEIFD